MKSITSPQPDYTAVSAQLGDRIAAWECGLLAADRMVLVLYGGTVHTNGRPNCSASSALA